MKIEIATVTWSVFWFNTTDRTSIWLLKSRTTFNQYQTSKWPYKNFFFTVCTVKECKHFYMYLFECFLYLIKKKNRDQIHGHLLKIFPILIFRTIFSYLKKWYLGSLLWTPRKSLSVEFCILLKSFSTRKCCPLKLAHRSLQKFCCLYVIDYRIYF